MDKCFCLSCRGSFKEEEDFDRHPCNPIFKMKNGSITVEISKMTGLKQTYWGRFVDRILEYDIGWGLAFMGLVVMNCVIIRHMDLTFTESLIESLSLGFAIPRLLK